MGLTWGIYPGRTSNNISDAPEHAEQIKNNLKLLKQGKEFFLVRGYIHYTGTLRIEKELPEHMILYAYGGIKIDLVLCYRSETGEVENWKVFICNALCTFFESPLTTNDAAINNSQILVCLLEYCTLMH